MAMALLEIIQRVTRAVGFPVPSTAYANSADDVQQFVELFNQEGRDLSARTNWQALTFQGSFTTVATESQGTLTAAIGATQILRNIINDTIWDRTAQKPVYGPVLPKVWQGYKALSLTGPYSEYRIRNNSIIFNPVPTAGHSCYFEYVSKCWCTDSTGVTYRTKVAADTDLMLLDEDIMCAGLEWRWKRAKGLSYAEEFVSYESLVSAFVGRDGTKAVLSMDNDTSRQNRGIFVPVGSWPL